jgi:hypothetical protein
MRAPLPDQRGRNDRIEDHRPRAPRVPNPNVVVLEEIVEEENFETFDQETIINQDEVLESVQMEEGSSYFYIFDEQEDPEHSQDNVVQTRTQVNKFKTREQPRKRKSKS